MPLSLEFWRTVQRLKVDTEHGERSRARPARVARRTRQPVSGSWRLLAVHGLAVAAPVLTALAVSPEALRRNGRLLLEAVALLGKAGA